LFTAAVRCRRPLVPLTIITKTNTNSGCRCPFVRCCSFSVIAAAATTVYYALQLDLLFALLLGLLLPLLLVPHLLLDPLLLALLLRLLLATPLLASLMLLALRSPTTSCFSATCSAL
jgi:hypothetical protein